MSSSGLFAPRAHATSPIGAIRARSKDDGDGGAPGAGEPGQSSANISGLGQLLSTLQQLQAQNPAQFTQVASQIASSLQGAAQKQAGGAGQLLANLADSLKQSAATGSLPEPNTSTEAQSYTRTGQPVTSTAVAGLASASSPGLPELFKALASQVDAALGA